MHQGQGLGPSLFVIVKRLTNEVRQQSLWTMIFVDGIVNFSEDRERKRQM